MGVTLDSTAVPYASAAQLIVQYDERQIGDLILDTNQRATQGQILASPVVQVALLRASGQVESACEVGAKYSSSDLSAIAFSGTDSASTNLLVGMTCALAFWFLWQRRHPSAKIEDCEGAKEATEMLHALRNGQAIFSTQEAQQAGLPQLAQWTAPQLDPRNIVRGTLGRFFGPGYGAGGGYGNRGGFGW